jgi:hypothetical protein
MTPEEALQTLMSLPTEAREKAFLIALEERVQQLERELGSTHRFLHTLLDRLGEKLGPDFVAAELSEALLAAKDRLEMDIEGAKLIVDNSLRG